MGGHELFASSHGSSGLACRGNLGRGGVPCKGREGWQGFSMVNLLDTLPETSSSPLKIGHPKRKFIFQP